MEIISRQHAISSGLKKYFTGKPCKNGHISPRYLAGGCESCINHKNYPVSLDRSKLQEHGIELERVKSEQRERRLKLLEAETARKSEQRERSLKLHEATEARKADQRERSLKLMEATEARKSENRERRNAAKRNDLAEIFIVVHPEDHDLFFTVMLCTAQLVDPTITAVSLESSKPNKMWGGMVRHCWRVPPRIIDGLRLFERSLQAKQAEERGKQAKAEPPIDYRSSKEKEIEDKIAALEVKSQNIDFSNPRWESMMAAIKQEQSDLRLKLNDC